MSRMTYNIDGVGKVIITDTNYLGSGGEAVVYAKNGLAIKIYHSQDKMIPLDKIKELKRIKDSRVLVPEHIVYKGSSTPVGYATTFKPNTHPLCKIFTNAFKKRNNVSNETINDLVMQMQETLGNIHKADCLAVDLNEMNEMISPKFDEVYFIDVDSYQTPSYHATAIMESIRDRLIKDNKWNEGSDWYSFAILAFQMWIGIHPYKGKHPDYKAKEWVKRMEDGISVFDSKSTLPRTCNDLSVIPKSHLGWLKDVFVNNARSAPPSMGDAMISAVPYSFKFISASKSFETNLVEKCAENIKDVFNFMGVNYILGSTNIHKGRAVLPIDISGADKVTMCESQSVDPVICILKNKVLRFYNESGKEFSAIAANDMMARNGCVYSVFDGKMAENSFIRMGSNLIHSVRQSSSIMDLSTQVFNGVVIQDLLGRKYITLPYGKGFCTELSVKELNGYRILDARSERYICGIIAEKDGKYHRFILNFNAGYNQYTIREVHDVPYSEINLTVLPNGVGILANDSDVEVFRESSIKVVDSPPFDSTTKIYNISGTLHFIDGKEIYTVKMK